jgi:phage N-6-adenine-methyltransferase
LNASTRRVMFSSENDKWSTPQDFYDKLDSEFNFTLDPCCTPESSKCYTFFTEEDDGLIQDWKGHTVFMNPPYGRSLRHWIRKAFEEGLKENTVVVALIPSRTDTRYWHEYCMKAKEIRFVKGRLKFGNSQNGAPFPSAVVIFDGHCPPRIETL